MSVTLHVVRHGEAASSWDKDPDPGLSELGHQQAEQAFQEIQAMTGGPRKLISSPLKRAQETASPFRASWKRTIEIVPAIAEIPSAHVPFSGRRAWLSEIMKGSWSEQEEVLLRWRQRIIDYLSGQIEDAVLFSHFMVINALVGELEQKDQILVFKPDNGSITSISVNDGQLSLIERGREAITVVS
ncbi:histidine phosphatase family protein [Sneathiella aquimaris]|uniref:histidine phosphatase family protein n=1 Tax=Sneathiella aquimaris TaxID=2599305 RepID=UPI00146C038D|nr:histidine phosphatase family protein [Sneathiella aquimaris]